MGSDLRFMQLAIQLAKRGVGQTGSNPAVGCVIVKNNRIIARSFTAPGGRPHAEALAIKQGGAECNGATLFVTLEPCAHHGQTLPCAQTIIDAKIARVVCPIKDPDPRVSGKGFSLLERSHILVDIITSTEAAAKEVIQGFSSRIKNGRPYITLKLGTSLDGKIASAKGRSQWITNSVSRKRGHLLRAQNNAILVGTNTFLNDSPKLNVRGSLQNFSSPLRIFLDQSLKIVPSKGILANVQKYPSIIVCGSKSNDIHHNIWKRENVEILSVNSNFNGINLTELCEALATKGINSLLVEGGGKLAKNLLLEGLIDQLIIYKSGVIIGADGVPSFAELNTAYKEIGDYPNFNLQSIDQYEDNLESVWKPF